MVDAAEAAVVPAGCWRAVKQRAENANGMRPKANTSVQGPGGPLHQRQVVRFISSRITQAWRRACQPLHRVGVVDVQVRAASKGGPCLPGRAPRPCHWLHGSRCWP